MTPFLPLYRVIYKFNQFDIDTVMREALFYDKEFTDKIIELNTRKQLFDKGVDAEGHRLDDGRRTGGPHDGYAGATIYGDPERGIVGKIEKGLPYDRITLYDEGDFYRSFRILITANFDLEITADTIKGTKDLLSIWGPEILGLTDESLSILREMAKKKTIDYMNRKLAA